MKVTETPDDRYALVSSLYGPGTTACWYLTILSCFVSWTLHPTKRQSGSVDNDFIAVLTFPTVAAAHLISQAYAYQDHVSRLESEESDLTLQISAAMEASLNITETSLAIGVVLFLIAVGFRCVKRAGLLALVGALGFSAEIYLYITCPFLRTEPRYLSRLFLTDFEYLIIAITVVVVILVTITLGLAVTFIARHEQEIPSRIDDPSLQSALVPESPSVKLFTLLTMLLMPISFAASAGPISVDAVSASPSDFLPWVRTTSSRFFRDLFPHTNVSVREIDQAVAVLAGTTVLGLSVYSAADAEYRSHRDRMQAWTQHRQSEQLRLERIRLQSRQRLPPYTA